MQASSTTFALSRQTFRELRIRLQFSLEGEWSASAVEVCFDSRRSKAIRCTGTCRSRRRSPPVPGITNDYWTWYRGVNTSARALILHTPVSDGKGFTIEMIQPALVIVRGGSMPTRTSHLLLPSIALHCTAETRSRRFGASSLRWRALLSTTSVLQWSQRQTSSPPAPPLALPASRRSRWAWARGDATREPAGQMSSKIYGRTAYTAMRLLSSSLGRSYVDARATLGGVLELLGNGIACSVPQ